MAVEEVRASPHHMKFTTYPRVQEFSIEIPDAEADEIHTVEQGDPSILHVAWYYINLGFSYRLYCQVSCRSVFLHPFPFLDN